MANLADSVAHVWQIRELTGISPNPGLFGNKRVQRTKEQGARTFPAREYFCWAAAGHPIMDLTAANG